MWSRKCGLGSVKWALFCGRLALLSLLLLFGSSALTAAPSTLPPDYQTKLDRLEQILTKLSTLNETLQADNSKLKENLQAALDTLTQAQAAFDAAKEALKLALSELQQSQEDLAIALNRLQRAESDLAILQASLERLDASFKTYKSDAEKTILAKDGWIWLSMIGNGLLAIGIVIALIFF